MIRDLATPSKKAYTAQIRYLQVRTADSVGRDPMDSHTGTGARPTPPTAENRVEPRPFIGSALLATSQLAGTKIARSGSRDSNELQFIGRPLSGFGWRVRRPSPQIDRRMRWPGLLNRTRPVADSTTFQITSPVVHHALRYGAHS
jgi:hypothetical protein